MVKHLYDKFHIVAVISNPIRYQSRWRLYREFEARIKKLGVNMITVELQQGHRAFQITEANNISHLQFRTLDELWLKESLINRGIHHLTRTWPDWKYCAWIDADVQFMRDDIIDETINQLQHYHVVQMFETAVDLGPTGQSLATHQSFMSQYIKGKPYCYGGARGKYYQLFHPGFAWAATRYAIESMGGLAGPLFDTSILGAGDGVIAHALIGMAKETLAQGLHPNYIQSVLNFEKRVERLIRRDVGFVNGTLLHYFHGKKRDRGYHSRWQILVKNQFDPLNDLERDSAGLYKLADHGDLRSIRLRDDIRRYLRSRNEDSTDLE